MQAKLVVVGGDAAETEIQLKLPTLVGRGKGSKLRLQHPLVSRQHCEIFEVDGQLKVRDLGSLNGTFVNNEKITEAALPSGQLLTIGAVTFRAIYEDEGVPATINTNKTVSMEKTVSVEGTVPVNQTMEPTEALDDEMMDFEVVDTPERAANIEEEVVDFELGADVDNVEEVEDASGILPPSAVPKGGAAPLPAPHPAPLPTPMPVPAPAPAPVAQPAPMARPVGQPAAFTPPPGPAVPGAAKDADDDDLQSFLKSLGK
jgi:pSer/pThr/pTyr-binding forkhead associated (FHA) protein